MARILEGNPNLSETLVVAASLGVRIEHRKGTGELLAWHEKWGRRVLINSRRKDTPRQFLVLVRKLAAP